MPPPPSLCGGFLTNKRSLVALTWTFTTLLTLVAFIMAIVMMVHVHAHYKWLERSMIEQYQYNQANRDDDDNNDRQGGGSQDRDEEWEELQAYLQMASMSSKSMSFCGVYTMLLAIGLSLYGSTAIVGFVSLRGVYIAPCFSSLGSPQLRLGVFGGAIVLFANLLLVCAVIFGEVRVEDWRDGKNQDDKDGNNNNQKSEPYEIERIATILAVTCMFLSALYVIFALMLFLYFGDDDSEDGDADDAVVVVSNKDPRRDNFITMPLET